MFYHYFRHYSFTSALPVVLYYIWLAKLAKKRGSKRFDSIGQQKCQLMVEHQCVVKERGKWRLWKLFTPSPSSSHWIELNYVTGNANGKLAGLIFSHPKFVSLLPWHDVQSHTKSKRQSPDLSALSVVQLSIPHLHFVFLAVHTHKHYCFPFIWERRWSSIFPISIDY